MQNTTIKNQQSKNPVFITPQVHRIAIFTIWLGTEFAGYLKRIWPDAGYFIHISNTDKSTCLKGHLQEQHVA